jgi:hypothetical protein
VASCVYGELDVLGHGDHCDGRSGCEVLDERLRRAERQLDVYSPMVLSMIAQPAGGLPAPVGSARRYVLQIGTSLVRLCESAHWPLVGIDRLRVLRRADDVGWRESPAASRARSRTRTAEVSSQVRTSPAV